VFSHQFINNPTRSAGIQVDIVARIIMDATIPYEWKEKPIEVKPDEEMKKHVLSRWQEYGFTEPY